jgi:hypothetical protein
MQPGRSLPIFRGNVLPPSVVSRNKPDERQMQAAPTEQTERRRKVKKLRANQDRGSESEVKGNMVARFTSAKRLYFPAYIQKSSQHAAYSPRCSLAYSSKLIMEVAYSYEMLINIYQTTRCNIPEYSLLFNVTLLSHKPETLSL